MQPTASIHVHGYPEDDLNRLTRRPKVLEAPCRPAIRLLENVFTRPASGGLYFSDGQAVPESFNSFVPRDVHVPGGGRAVIAEKLSVHWPDQIAIESPEHFNRQVFWGGELTDHYGHFLCETMGRMWALPLIPRKATILFTARGNTRLDTPFVQDFFRALGVLNRIQIVDRPLRLKNAFVAEPALQHVYRLYSEFAEPHEAVGRKLDDGVARNRPVYLSRSKFSGRSAGAAEAKVEEFLTSRGVDVVHPERLTLAQQVNIFRNAPAVIGLMGSGFHTSLFTEPGKSPVMAQFSWEKINRRFMQFDDLKGTTTHYLKCSSLQGYRQGVTLDYDAAITLLKETGIV